jgi:hypothetical protein
MDEQPILEIERPRSAFDLLAATIELYRRYPWLFPTLAFAIVVPYQVIVLLATDTGPLGGSELSVGTTFLLLGIESFLVTPVISALHVHAVDDAREGRDPTLGSVARRGLVTLPVVVAAAIISTLGIAAGFVLLIVPGIYLSLRFAVVAQAAALEEGGWIDALKRSGELADKNYLHIFGVVLLIGVISGGVFYVVGLAFDASTTTAASFIVGTVVAVFVRSFTALATALLFFDLKARRGMAPAARQAETEPHSPSAPVVPPTGHPLDADSWSDLERPAGWYIDPAEPTKMRYWPAGYQPQWSTRRARTPNKTYDEWIAYRKGADSEEADREDPA